MPKKDFTDKRAEKKEKQQSKANRQALKRHRKEVKTALENHNLGWRTQDGKEF